MPAVMLHGDTWTNNIFFERDTKSGVLGTKMLAMIDWQGSSAGCGLMDLAHFSALCVGEELRQKFEKDVIKRYFDRLDL